MIITNSTDYFNDESCKEIKKVGWNLECYCFLFIQPYIQAHRLLLDDTISRKNTLSFQLYKILNISREADKLRKRKGERRMEEN